MVEPEALLSSCRKLPAEIASAAEAIVRYVSSQTGSPWREGDSGRWRPAGENFVTLKPQWKQAQSLAVTIRGNPGEFEQSQLLPVVRDQNGYSAFRLQRADQIADAFGYIKRAQLLFERGRARSQSTPKTIG